MEGSQNYTEGRIQFDFELCFTSLSLAAAAGHTNCCLAILYFQGMLIHRTADLEQTFLTSSQLSVLTI